MNPSDPIAALEIGTSRTAIAIAEPLPGGRIKIATLSSIPSSGVRKSQIVDVGQARYSLESVLKHLADQSDYSINQAYLAVSGPQIRATPTIEQCPVAGGVVRDEEIAEIESRSGEAALPADRYPIEYSPVCYKLDDVDNIASPRGMSGRLLSLRALSIHGSAQRIADARTAARDAKLEISDIAFAGICAATAVLVQQDKRDGALVIDLGGGSTSYTAWADGQLAQAGVIGVGGDHVTNDVRVAFAVSQSQAEQLKTSAASAIIVAEDATIRVPVPNPMPGFKAPTVSRRALNTVVNARLQELFTIIRIRIDEAGLLHRLNSGVVLTGGGSAMPGIVELATAVFGNRVRIGTFVPEIEGLPDDTPPASYAVLAGLLLRAYKQATPEPSILDTFKNLFKRIFGK